MTLPLSDWSTFSSVMTVQIMLLISRSSTERRAPELVQLPLDGAAPLPDVVRRVLDPDPARQVVLRDAQRRALRVLEPAEEDRRSGCCSGLAPNPHRSKSANSPWYSKRSFIQMPCMISIVSRTCLCRLGKMCAALAAANSSGIQPEPTPTLSLPPAEVVDRRHLGGEDAGARNGVSVMLMPIRTFVVFAASQGISGMPWNHSPREDTGRALGSPAHHAERVLELLAVGGFRDDDPVERPDGVEVEVLGEAGEILELLEGHLGAEVRQVESKLHDRRPPCRAEVDRGQGWTGTFSRLRGDRHNRTNGTSTLPQLRSAGACLALLSPQRHYGYGRHCGRPLPRSPSVSDVACSRVLVVDDDQRVRTVVCLAARGGRVRGHRGRRRRGRPRPDRARPARPRGARPFPAGRRRARRPAPGPRSGAGAATPLPVIVLSGRSGDTDRIIGLDLGADDYLVKPFSPGELAARVRSVLRRARPGAVSARPADGLRVDETSRDVTLDGRPVDLTAKEFDLLAFLARHPRQVFTRAQLLQHVWGSAKGWQSEATVTEHVHRLRQKLGSRGDGRPIVADRPRRRVPHGAGRCARMRSPPTHWASFDLDHADSLGLLRRQTSVLELIATGTPLADVLTCVVVALEELIEGSRCSILLLDPATATLHHGAAPSLPAAYSARIDGLPVGPEEGSCGAAAYLGTPVVAADIRVRRALAAVPRCRDTARDALLLVEPDPGPHRHRRHVRGLPRPSAPPAAARAQAGRPVHAPGVGRDRPRRAVRGARGERRPLPPGVRGQRRRHGAGRGRRPDGAGEPGAAGHARSHGAPAARLRSRRGCASDGGHGGAARAARQGPGGQRALRGDGPAHRRSHDRPRRGSVGRERRGNGVPVNLSVNLLDITQRRAAERERRARLEAEVARAAAEAASRAKSEFVAALNHELRTPLQAITGFTELLRTLDLPPDRRQAALEHIGAATEHVLSMVDDLLDIAKIEADALPIRVEPVELCGLLDEVLALLAPLAAEHNVILRPAVPAGRGAVRADRRRLRQVLINLVTNGVRYNCAGGWVEVGAKDSGASTVTVAVRDSGRGIPAEMIEPAVHPVRPARRRMLGRAGRGPRPRGRPCPHAGDGRHPGDPQRAGGGHHSRDNPPRGGQRLKGSVAGPIPDLTDPSPGRPKVISSLMIRRP